MCVLIFILIIGMIHVRGPRWIIFQSEYDYIRLNKRIVLYRRSGDELTVIFGPVLRL